MKVRARVAWGYLAASLLGWTCTRANPDYIGPGADGDADADTDADSDADADADADTDSDGDADADSDGDADADSDGDADADADADTDADSDADADADGDADIPCVGDERGCSEDGERTYRCEELTFTVERTCPEPTSCIGGHCDSAGRPGCASDAECAEGEVCAPLVNFAQPTEIRRYCVSPVGPVAGLQACALQDDCQTGVCAGGECFLSCANGLGCPDGRDCVVLLITVDGVTDAVRGCD